METTGATRLTGLIGWPVAHSLSPRLHSYWLRQAGIDGVYVPLAVSEAGLRAAVAGLAAMGFRGVNVTVPHKQSVFGLCDEVEAAAGLAGAVNTLVFAGARVVGRNTDGAGFLRSLEEAGVNPAAGPALVLGTGGAARGIAAALRGVGAEVWVTGRSDLAATALAGALPGVRVRRWSEAPKLAGVRLLVNATSGGMEGKAALAVRLDSADCDMVVADIVYAPRETDLLFAARARGLRCVEGIGMLLHQAALSFEAWSGVRPVVDEAARDFVLMG